MRNAFMTLSAVGIAGLWPVAVPLHAQNQPDPMAEDAEIVVRGDLPRCHTRPGDPLDDVDVDGAPFVQSVIKLDPATDVWRVKRDDDPITGPEVWQRAGKGIADFRFRAPASGDLPMCIGTWARAPRGWGQLRRVLDARPLHGRYVRFTALVATRKSSEVRFWLAAGDNGRRVLQGGDTSAQPLRGSRAWMPVELTIGPIPKLATKVSYGFLLKGAGDVWVLNPRHEILDIAAPAPGHPSLRRHDREQ